MKKVKLVKELTPQLPLGTIGEVVEGDPDAPGMTMVRWFGWLVIPHWNNEIENVADDEQLTMEE